MAGDSSENMQDKNSKKDIAGGAGKSKNSKKSPGTKRKRARFGLRIKFSMAILSLVVLVIVTMTLYIIDSESKVLKKEMIKLAEREIEHLHNNAVDALSSESELQLLVVMQDLKKLKTIKYAYILDNRNTIRQNFDPEKNGTILKDKLIDKISSYKETKKPLRLLIPDKGGGLIYDFSKPLFDKIFDRRIGTVRLGFSDREIRDEIRKLARNIIMALQIIPC